MGGHPRLSSYNLLAPGPMLRVALQGKVAAPRLLGRRGRPRLQMPCVLGHRGPSQILALHLLPGPAVQLGRVCTASKLLVGS